MVIKVEGYGKLLKFLEGVLKIDLIARTLYHFEGIGWVGRSVGRSVDTKSSFNAAFSLLIFKLKIQKSTVVLIR